MSQSNGLVWLEEPWAMPLIEDSEAEDGQDINPEFDIDRVLTEFGRYTFEYDVKDADDLPEQLSEVVMCAAAMQLTLALYKALGKHGESAALSFLENSLNLEYVFLFDEGSENYTIRVIAPDGQNVFRLGNADGEIESEVLL